MGEGIQLMVWTTIRATSPKKGFRNRGRDKKSTDGIKNVMMFAFCMAILVEIYRDKIGEEMCHFCLGN